MTAEGFLLHVPLFRQIGHEDRKRLADALKARSYKKGETLFHRGSEGDSLFIIKEGKIKISLLSTLGDEVVLAIFSEGDFFGEMALLDGMPRSADATAIEPSEVLTLSREDFLTFLMSNAGAIRSILESLSRRLRKTDDLLEDTCFLNISARFAKKLVEMSAAHGRREGKGAVIELDLTQRDLASMIGATRESVNKELRVLREKGLVSTEENSIHIHDLERLRRRSRRSSSFKRP